MTWGSTPPLADGSHVGTAREVEAPYQLKGRLQGASQHRDFLSPGTWHAQPRGHLMSQTALRASITSILLITGPQRVPSSRGGPHPASPMGHILTLFGRAAPASPPTSNRRPRGLNGTGDPPSHMLVIG